MTGMTGKTVMITGASRGIGAAAAREFHDLGANVVMLARSGDRIGALARELGGRALAIACDVSSWNAVQAAVAQTHSHFGGVDILINNAGVIEPISPLASSDPEAWSHAVDINLKGAYYGMRAVLPLMRRAGGGTILTVSSGAAHVALEGWSQYCSAKAGVHMLNMCLDKESAGHGIRALTLSPGTVATDMQRVIKHSGINPVSSLEWSDHIPPEWPAKALVWMCSPDADDFLGQEVPLSDPEIRRRIGLA